MKQITDNLDLIFNFNINIKIKEIVLSKPTKNNTQYKKIVIDQKGEQYQTASYTPTQVFHKTLSKSDISLLCAEQLGVNFLQFNAWDNSFEYIIMVSKKGQVTYKKQTSNKNFENEITHNRKKNYILNEGEAIAPLVDMGIFTKDGKVVASMYDKFKQINRFVEIIDDEVKLYNKKELNIIDFGCGKSYLTFILYYYFTEIKNIKVNIVGLDLKQDVIEKCNKAAEKYGYENLRFELGDINGYTAEFDVDMVITLHACDTATDYALYNAIQWGAKMIFSVPCCQHEVNAQIKTDSYSVLTKYGIIKERFSALATDAIRANLLEYSGYKTQVLEFVDLSHTPKNILIRAVKKKEIPAKAKEKALQEIESLISEFNLTPTLYGLLIK